MRNAILILSFLLSFSVFGQNPFERKVNFEYIRLPQQPLKKSIKNYQAAVVAEYEAEVAAKKDAFAKVVQDYEKKYNEEMAAYDKNLKEAGIRYAQEMIEYNKLIQNPANANLPKPVLTLPTAPQKFVPIDNNYYPKSFNPQSLASTYISLDGYLKLPDNAVQLTALLKGFQYTEPELKVNDKKVKTKEGTEIIEKEYYYEFNYRHPMGLKVEVPGEGVVFYEYFEDLNRYTNVKTDRYKSEAEAKAGFNRDTYFSNLEDRVVAENLKYVNNAMNSRFGFARLRVEESIYLINGKKHNYSDYQQAFETVVTGLNQLSADLNKTVAADNIKAGINIWENALKESQPNNKKARINGNVTTATLFNIALMSIYADDFVKAEIYLNKVLSTDASKKEQRKVERIRVFLREQQTRYEAYKRTTN